MIKLLSYLIGQGVATQKNICPPHDETFRGLPQLTKSPCDGAQCKACVDVCPTDAISVLGEKNEGKVLLDLGACIQCGLCIDGCPTGTIGEYRSTRVAAKKREDLLLTNDKDVPTAPASVPIDPPNMFTRSVHARVVSTGCSSCDLELGASGNPVFDIERFGVHVVASPRFADALIITGPVSKGMQTALSRCYQAMAEPRVVIAMGTCAISGGVHRHGYANGNGASNVLPVDVFVPGCPPHPWSVIHGVLVAMNRIEPFKPSLLPAKSPSQEAK